MAATETTFGLREIDPVALRTLGKVKFDSFENGVHGTVTTAHPTVLPNGDMLNLHSEAN